VSEDAKFDGVPELPQVAKGGMASRAILNVASGVLPFAGGLLAAIGSAWSEHEQKRVNDFLHHWLQMLATEMREKEQTILEIMARIDMRDEETAKRVESPEYQELLRKAFRDWAGAESEKKREYIRNLLANAAGANITSDDVIRLFLEWIKNDSELHFAVIAVVYNRAGITRGGIWRQLGRAPVREDSSDADLFKLLIRDLSTGGIIRQHRETDYAGNFVIRRPQRSSPSSRGQTKPMKSAFDEEEQYELTALGQEFVHYAMTDVPPKIEFHQSKQNSDSINTGNVQ
jgi:hypothetical protein